MRCAQLGLQRASIDYEPRSAGARTQINITFQLDDVLGTGEIVNLDLPDFSGVSVQNASCFGMSSARFTVHWINETIQLIAEEDISASTLINVVVKKENGITLPTTKLRRNDDSIRISTLAAAGRIRSARVQSPPIAGMHNSWFQSLEYCSKFQD